MAQIGLRVYDREIESMIDRGQIDEAIAHSKHILKDFPKHIETYRLLGKCYLESQRYLEAADILQRVLSVFPDDFISHIGMSIICEDENDLEKAIWHMDRALEVQPSNSAVNSELRRLMTLRDGSEPSKVHLSQGAYIRMCVKSGLHEQAIAEAKSALSKEPQRIDLDLILAKMYSETGQKSSAVDQLTIILNKLPYCYDANLLMMQILISTNRAAEATTYKERLIAIDPYFAFINSEATSPDLVADDAVSLEKNEWQLSDDDTQRHTKILGTDWQDAKGPLATSGVTTKSFNQDSLPDDLPDENMIPSVEGVVMAGIAEQVLEEKSPEYEEEQTQEFKELRQEPTAEPIPEPTPEPVVIEEPILEEEKPSSEIIAEASLEPAIGAQKDQDIPDFMKSAGWVQSDGQTEEAPASEGLATDPIPSSDIPDWIKTMAPPDQQPSAEELAAESEKMELLDKILPESSPTSESAIPETEISGFTAISDIEGNPPAVIGGITFESLGLPAETETTSIQQPKSEEVLADQNTPDWMQAVQQIAEPVQESNSEELPETGLPVWMALDEQVEEEKLEFPDQKSLASEALQSTETYMSVSGEAMPDWLASDQNEVSSLQEPLVSSESQGAEPEISSEIPDIYSSDIQSNEALPAWMSPAGGNEGISGQIPEEEIPEWLREEVSATPNNLPIADETLISAPIAMTGEKTDSVGVSTPQDFGEIPDWLKEVNTDQNPVLSIPDDDILPEWAKPEPVSEPKPVSEPELVITPEAIMDGFVQGVVTSQNEQTAGSLWEQPVQPMGDFSNLSEPSSTAVDSGPGLNSLLDQLSQSGIVQQETAAEPPLDVAPLAAAAVAEVASTSGEHPQDEPPFINVESYEESEPRGDETLVSKPFVELEKQAQNPSVEKEPVDIRAELVSSIESPSAAQSDEIESAVPDLEFNPDQPGIEELEQPVMESVPLDQPIPDDTLDMTADIDIESWLNSLQESSPLPGVEPAASAPDGVEQIQEQVFQELSTPVDEESFPVPRAHPPVETAPLVGLEEEVKAPDLSPLDELEEAGQFQSSPVVENLMDTLRAKSLDQVEISEASPVEEIAKEPLVQETISSTESFISERGPLKIPESYEEMLDYANSSISEGNLDNAITTFNSLIKKGNNLDETIQSLRSAIYRFPSEVIVWQALGDGYAKSNRLQEALDAYTKAEELIR